ncbi:MAG TPA: hypothetical protein VF950_16100, partial [Planctomycetota bacterium]
MEEPPPPAGFRSEDAKRAYGKSVAIAAVFFFILEFTAPIVGFVVAIPALMFSGAMRMTLTSIDSAARWEGDLWALGQTLALSRNAPTGLTLYQHAGEAEPRAVARLTDPDARILAGTDVLWILEEGRVSVLKNGDLESYGLYESLGARTRPFLSKGMPAVIEMTPEGGFELRILGPDAWARAGRIDLPAFAPGVDFRDRVQPLGGAAGELHLFRDDGFAIFHRVARPGEAAPAAWTTVAEAHAAWKPFLHRGAPAVAAVERAPVEEGLPCRVRLGHRRPRGRGGFSRPRDA